ncbi:MAG TPA: hypothetical protein VL400_16815, partial [Polyangiaceae bacterium]|nr:hypothetical protein [Polyangiaceae bacterium]
MWVRRAAIRPVPRFAEVPARVLEALEDELSEERDDSKKELDRAFERFEERQPFLSAHLGEALTKPKDETALALGYFLTLAIWMSFERTFR